MLKEYAVFLAQPVSDILNASYKEQKLPSVWKLADVTPLPKVKQVSDPKKELRPISLTPALSKIAEDFIVSDYIKPALEEKVAPNQYHHNWHHNWLFHCYGSHKHGAQMASKRQTATEQQCECFSSIIERHLILSTITS